MRKNEPTFWRYFGLNERFLFMLAKIPQCELESVNPSWEIPFYLVTWKILEKGDANIERTRLAATILP